MQTPLRTLGIFNSSYSSFCCLNVGCTSNRKPIDISTVGIIRSHTWIMESLIGKNRAEFDTLQDHIMFSTFKGSDLGKRILTIARTYIKFLCDCRISMTMPSQNQIDDIRDWEQRQNLFTIRDWEQRQNLFTTPISLCEFNSESSNEQGRLFEGESAEFEDRDSEEIYLCLKDSKNPGSGLDFYGNADNLMQLPALERENIIISKISHELMLELAKSSLISDINRSILFRLQSLNISNFDVGARENDDDVLVVGVVGAVERVDNASIEIYMDQQSSCSSNLSEDQSSMIPNSTPYSSTFVTHVIQTNYSKTNKET